MVKRAQTLVNFHQCLNQFKFDESGGELQLPFSFDCAFTPRMSCFDQLIIGLVRFIGNFQFTWNRNKTPLIQPLVSTGFKNVFASVINNEYVTKQYVTSCLLLSPCCNFNHCLVLSLLLLLQPLLTLQSTSRHLYHTPKKYLPSWVMILYLWPLKLFDIKQR